MRKTLPKVDEYLATVPEWQKAYLQQFRKLVHEASPDIEEDFKWNVPVFMLSGKTIFAMSGFKAHTKYNFILNGALLEDPEGLFNNGFESAKSRGIDRREGENIDEASLGRLIDASIQLMTT